MDKLYDVVIVGGGPAGLTAALYLARAKYHVIVLEKEQLGGQITITDEVVNYPGIKSISGRELTETIRMQAESFGANFALTEATGFEFEGDIKTVHTAETDYRCFGILLATGANPRTVGFKGEDEFKGRGVAYCATCDGEFFTGKEVFVVGGGFAAAEESVFLTKFASHVTILIRENDFSCAAAVAEKAKSNSKITVLTNTVLEEVSGEKGLTYARYKNTATGEITEYHSKNGESFGVFVFVGYAPDTELVRGSIELDERGYIITDGSQKTNIDGVYAAGDVCIKPLRQVVTATGDGALSATELEKYVAQMQQKTGIRPEPPSAKVDVFAAAERSAEQFEDDELFSSQMKQQLSGIFEKTERALVLRLYLDKRQISAELEHFTAALVDMSEKLSMRVADRHASSDTAPFVQLCLENGEKTGLAFHGVPGGHEFTSFVLGLYNAAGPGQAMDEQLKKRIAKIEQPVDIKILVSLSCTMCPEAVIAAQHIAAENPKVNADVYDIHHFEGLKRQYNVMSVPCLVVNDKTVSFGKKNMAQILDIIEKTV